MRWILILSCLIESMSAQSSVSVHLKQLSSFTEVYVGNRLDLRFDITFPDSATTEGVVVEIVLSLEEFNVAIGDIILCKTGSSLTVSNVDYCEANTKHLSDGFTEQDGVQHHHVVVFDVGTVTSSGGTIDTNTINITFEAVFVEVGTLTNGDEFYLGASVLYDNEDKIWVALDAYTFQGFQSGPDTEPTFELIMVTDDEIADNAEKQKVQLTFGIPNPQAEVKIEFLSMNDTDCGLSIHDVGVVSAGTAYEYSLVLANLVADSYDQCCPNSVILDVGKLTNKESTKEGIPDPEQYNIVIEATVLATNYTIPDGETLATAVSVFIDDNQIWVAYIPAIKRDGTNVSNADPITFATTTDGDIVPAGMPCFMDVTVTTVPGAKKYTIAVRTEQGTAAAPRLSILAVNPVEYGGNIPCKISANDIMLTKSDSDNDGIFEQFIVEITMTNYDTFETVAANNVKFQVSFLMSPDAVEAETVSAIVNGDPTLSETFTVGPGASYDDDAKYDFAVTEECGVSYPVGSVIKFTLDVTTERHKTPGPGRLEFPIPAVLDPAPVPTLTFVSATVVYVGWNVGCVQFGPLDTNLSYWDPDQTEGPFDRAVANIFLCNKEQNTDAEQDKIKIEIKVQIINNADLNAANATTNVSFNIGWHYTGKHIWLAEFDIKTVMSNDFGDGILKHVEGVALNADVTWPSGTVIEWSPDNVDFYRHNSSWEPYVLVPGVQTEMTLVKPLFARYTRIVNTDGQCPVSSAYTATDVLTNIEFHGGVELVKLFRQSMMFLLDADNTTCLTLPTKTATTTTRFLYVSIKTILPYLNTNGSAPFSILVTGAGLICNTPFGPQVTKVSHRKDGDAFKFTGNRRKCTLAGEEVDGSLQSCRYYCDCTDDITCGDVSLMILHHDTPAGEYTLCDVTAYQ